MLFRVEDREWFVEEKGYVFYYDRREGGKNVDKCINFGVSVEIVFDDGFKFFYEVKEGEWLFDREGNREKVGVWERVGGFEIVRNVWRI